MGNIHIIPYLNNFINVNREQEAFKRLQNIGIYNIPGFIEICYYIKEIIMSLNDLQEYITTTLVQEIVKNDCNISDKGILDIIYILKNSGSLSLSKLYVIFSNKKATSNDIIINLLKIDNIMNTIKFSVTPIHITNVPTYTRYISINYIRNILINISNKMLQFIPKLNNFTISYYKIIKKELNNPTALEKNFMLNIWNKFKMLNLLESFEKFDLLLEEEKNRVFKSIMNHYIECIEGIFIIAHKNCDQKFYSTENIKKIQSKIKAPILGCVLLKFNEYLESDKHKHMLESKIKKYNKILKLPTSFKKTAKYIKNNYPFIFQKLPLYYKNKQNKMSKLSLDKDGTKLFKIQNILDGSCHNNVDRYSSTPGLIYKDKIIFYTSYKSIMFMYNDIPDNVFWNIKYPINATYEYLVNLILTINKSSSISRIPIEIIIMIITFIPLNKLCKFHIYQKSEIFK